MVRIEEKSITLFFVQSTHLWCLSLGHILRKIWVLLQNYSTVMMIKYKLKWALLLLRHRSMSFWQIEANSCMDEIQICESLCDFNTKLSSCTIHVIDLLVSVTSLSRWHFLCHVNCSINFDWWKLIHVWMR